MIQRRTFLVATAALLLQPPHVGEAQSSALDRRIGILTPDPMSQRGHLFEALRTRLRELGYVEGSDVTVETRSAEGRWMRCPR